MFPKEFIKIDLNIEQNLFEKLSKEINFENIGKGRLANNLVANSERGVPIIRTTSLFNTPSFHFTPTTYEIINQIKSECKDSEMNFNNALIEIYDSSYRKMKYHSDLNMDLKPNTFIGLFSCYKNPKTMFEEDVRVLKIKDKKTHEEFEITLGHNSFVLFSTEVNSRFYHKIVLAKPGHNHKSESKNQWLGLTFRESKTYIQFVNDNAFISKDQKLELATEEEKLLFFKLRGEENRSLNFEYPTLLFTLSKSDLLYPIKK